MKQVWTEHSSGTHSKLIPINFLLRVKSRSQLLQAQSPDSDQMQTCSTKPKMPRRPLGNSQPMQLDLLPTIRRW
jgi:hypothetical protein